MHYDWLTSLKNSPVASLNRHLFEQEKKAAKRSKYNNKKLEVDGHVFDSKKEANRYWELRIMLTAKLIQNLLLQVPYELNEGGTHSLKYIADFVYQDVETGKTVVEDAKGFATKEFKKKARLMQKVHGIVVRTV